MNKAFHKAASVSEENVQQPPPSFQKKSRRFGIYRNARQRRIVAKF